MNPDTDPKMRRLLEEVPIPEHADGFWATLHDELDTGAERPVRLDERRHAGGSRGRQMLAAAAAAVLVVAGVGIYLATDDETPVPVTSDPDPTTSTPTSVDTVEAGTLRPDGDPVSLGSGQVVAVSPDGEWLYVTNVHPDGGNGCEGAPRQALYVRPVGGGDQVLATDEPIDVGGAAQMRFGPDGSAAVLSQCESFLGGVLTGTIGAGGVLTDSVDLPVDDISSIVDFEWARAGVLLVATYGLGSEEAVPPADGRALIEIDVTTGEKTALPPTGYIYIDVTDEPTIVSRDNVGTVRFGNEELGTEGSVYDLEASDDGRFVVTAGEKGITVYDRETGEQERVFDEPAYSLSLLDTGDIVFIVRDLDGRARVVSVHPGEIGSGDHSSTELFSDAGFGRLTYVAVAPDGSDLWVSYLTDAPLPVLLHQPLTR